MEHPFSPFYTPGFTRNAGYLLRDSAFHPWKHDEEANLNTVLCFLMLLCVSWMVRARGFNLMEPLISPWQKGREKELLSFPTPRPPPNRERSNASEFLITKERGERTGFFPFPCSPSPQFGEGRSIGLLFTSPPPMYCILASLGSSKVFRLGAQKNPTYRDSAWSWLLILHPPRKKHPYWVQSTVSPAGDPKPAPKWSVISWESASDDCKQTAAVNAH